VGGYVAQELQAELITKSLSEKKNRLMERGLSGVEGELLVIQCLEQRSCQGTQEQRSKEKKKELTGKTGPFPEEK